MVMGEPETPVRLAEAARGRTGSEVKVLACLQQVTQRQTQRGEPYLDLCLCDASGTLGAKVWSGGEAFQAARDLERGRAVVAWGHVEDYRGTIGLVVSRLHVTELSSDARRQWVYGEHPDEVEAFEDRVVGFDIETAPLGDPLPASLAARLERHARVALHRDGIEATREAMADRMRLEQATNPLLGRLVSVALMDADTSRARVLIAASEPASAPETPAETEVRFTSEADLLGSFWRVAAFVRRLVSFNGEDFDLPFVEMRSRILGVLPRERMPPSRHTDLRRLLRSGRGHLGSLELCCHAFGVASPKGTHTGGDVERLHAEGRYAELVSYNLGDVRATLELWRRVEPEAD